MRILVALLVLWPAALRAAELLEVWTHRHAAGVPLNAVAFGNDTFVAVGGAGIGTTLSSPDGVSWTQSTNRLVTAFVDVIYGDGMFVALGGNLAVTSRDGTNWTTRLIGSKQTVFGGAYGNDRFLVVGQGGLIATSKTGEQWQVLKTELTTSIRNVAFLKDQFFLFLENGNALLSQDGTSWQVLKFGAITGLRDGAYGNGRYVLMTPTGIIVTSEDRGRWQRGVDIEPSSAITFINDLFLVPSNNGVVLSSANGDNWIAHDAKLLEALTGLAFGRGTYVVTSSLGTILQSGDPARPIATASIPPAVVAVNVYAGLDIEGSVGSNCEVFYTPSVENPKWISLQRFKLPSSRYRWFDSTPVPNSASRFYKAVLTD